ncbi:MAG TPA: PP2C family protein-serine/threonine phosphatase [Candidatus Acidoferrales bacterium]|nr:PP2C family protein-serine/threonine phosphatase [Candidatus Acidoferrales bacterium]
MSAPSNSIPNPRRKRTGRVRVFWERVTEGLELEQLWGQFLSDAKESYGLYSREVDWDEIHRNTRGLGRYWRGAWAVFQALLMKLTPARRVLLLIAVALLIFQPEVRSQHGQIVFNLGWLSTWILFVLLALELADRVTMKRDLEIAREIQQNLVPEHPPAIEGFDFAFATRPQNTVAGDYYDAFLRPLADASGVQPLLVIVADVAGKSVPAALLMATFQASLRALSSTSEPLEAIVAGLDRYARAHSLEGRRFTTAFLAEINPATREMRYTNAGHNNPILRRASGQIERLTTGGPPFGLPLFSENEFKYESGTTNLGAGDLLVIFTDGVVEAVDDRGEEFGESRLMPCIESAPPEDAAATLQRVMTQVNKFVGYARQHDDITCLVLRVNP